MVDLLLEWCADAFGVTVRSRVLFLLLGGLALTVLGVVMMESVGLKGWLLPLGLALFALAAARSVLTARTRVWRAACLDLDDPRQSPHADSARPLLPPSAAALHRLAVAVDDVRRGRFVEATAALPQIDRDLLRSEENQLLDAVRALISLGLGDSQRAARLAVAALPTGSEELDSQLGRTVVAEAWKDPARLLAIYEAWERAGLRHDRRGALGRLQRLTRLRIDTSAVDRLHAEEARDLADEARAIGDDDLASDLDARG
ncbi:MAG: hypothetical protein ABI193_14210, partial [Minicystis sp.]